MHFKGSHILNAMDQDCDYYNKSKKEKWKTEIQDEFILDPMFYERTFQNSIK